MSETKNYVLGNFSINLENTDPYKELDEDTKEAAICLMTIGRRFHSPKRQPDSQELNELIPLMKDAIDCVDNISKIKSKAVSTNFILNHKAVYSDLLASSKQKRNKIQ